jgi:hypothetical protein
VTGQWFSAGPPVSSTYKTDHHDIAEILLKGTLSTINQSFYAPATKSRGGILIRSSGYRYMVCPAISSYSFEPTALIFFRMFIHIMEVCMSTGF